MDQWFKDLRFICEQNKSTEEYLAAREVYDQIITMIDTGKNGIYPANKEEIQHFLQDMLNTPYRGSHTQRVVSLAISLLHQFFPELYPSMEEENTVV